MAVLIGSVLLGGRLHRLRLQGLLSLSGLPARLLGTEEAVSSILDIEISDQTAFGDPKKRALSHYFGQQPGLS